MLFNNSILRCIIHNNDILLTMDLCLYLTYANCIVVPAAVKMNRDKYRVQISVHYSILYVGTEIINQHNWL